MKDEVDAAVERFLAEGAERLRRRTENLTAILMWGADMYPGGPFPDAFTTGQARPAAPADTGSHNRHRRRRTAAKARH